jgi:hypothetical protein
LEENLSRAIRTSLAGWTGGNRETAQELHRRQLRDLPPKELRQLSILPERARGPASETRASDRFSQDDAYVLIRRLQNGNFQKEIRHAY